MDPSRRDFVKHLAGTAALGGLLSPVRHAYARELARQDVDFDALRRAYCLSPEVTYLNHGSIGTIPRVLLETMTRYHEMCESNPWLHVWGEAWEEAAHDTRTKVQRLLGCDVEEVALIRSTTEGFNVLARGLPLGPGDEVVFSSLNHVGASACWHHFAAERGFTVKPFEHPLDDLASLTTAGLLELYDAQLTAATRVLVLPHLDNLVGIRHPVREIVDLARAQGVEFIAVDGAQSLGMFPVDVKALGVDFYASSPHKWIQAPKGTGVLYVRRDVQESLRPASVTWGQRKWSGSARRYEDYGTRDFVPILTLGHAVDFQERIGEERKERRREELWRHARAAAERTPGVEWRSPRQWGLSGSLYTVEVPGRDAPEIFDRLYRTHGFVFRAFARDGFSGLRLSPNVANTTEEIDRFFELLGSEVR